MTFPTVDPKTLEEILAHINCEDIATYRKNAEMRAELWAEAKQYIDLPPMQWPRLNFNWDLNEESQRFALDGVKAKEFRLHYPEGFRIGWVSLPEFDAKLCHFSRRDTPEELWELGSETKLAEVIAYVARGLPITPPLVRPLNDVELIFQGGHHRYAAAKASSQTSIPIMVEPINMVVVARLVSVNWKST